MIKLTIAHSIAQSCKLALFEGLMEETIESTKHVPHIMAEEGKIRMSRWALLAIYEMHFVSRSVQL
jgi:uncharacterized Rmd1/YagE family protein